jgi:Ca2+-binding RTX toxin-like protein
MPTVDWGLGVGESLTNFITQNAPTGGGGSYVFTGTGGRFLGFYDPNSNPIGNPTTPGSTAPKFQFGVSSTSIVSAADTINTYAFYQTLIASGVQDAIDYLFGTLGTSGNAYKGATGTQVFEAFRAGDGFIGDAGDDLFKFGRTSVSDIAYVHGGNAGSDPNAADEDTIEFVASVGRTYHIHIVTNIDKVVFNDSSTTAVFYLDGATSFLPSNLKITQTAGLGTVHVRTEVDAAVNWNFSGWALTAGSGVTTVLLDTFNSVRDDVIVGPSGGGTIYSIINTYGGDDSITSGAAGDTIDAGDGNDTINSGVGQDSVLGGAGDDVIDAGDGADTVDGGAGDDLIFSSTTNNEIVEGGLDDDIMSYERLTSNSTAGAGFSVTSEGGGMVQINSAFTVFTGVEILRGTQQGDSFSNNTGFAETYQGLAGHDIFFGGSGVDTLDYGSDYLFDHGSHNRGVVINATSGTIGNGQGPADIDLSMLGVILNPSTLGSGEAQGTFGTTTIESVDYFDFDGFSSIEVFLGSILADFMVGSEGAETLGGNAGDDWLYGEGGADSLAGDAGNDHLYGGAQNDTLNGGANNDTLDGGAGIDTLLGGTGHDLYFVNHKNDVIDETGGNGTDSVSSSVSFSLVASAKVIGTFERLTLTGTAASATGNASANVLTGNDANNTLTGGGGADTLKGGGGTDTASYATAAKGVVVNLADATKNTRDATGDIFSSIEKFVGSGFNDRFTGNNSANSFDGGNGVDVIDGGLGMDTLKGGASGDRFVFSTKLVSTNVDTIIDFSHAAGDRILLDDAIFKAIGPSLTAAEFYAANGATAAHDATDRIIYNKTNGKLLYDDDGTGSHKAVHFATLSGHPALVVGDFSIA